MRTHLRATAVAACLLLAAGCGSTPEAASGPSSPSAPTTTSTSSETSASSVPAPTSSADTSVSTEASSDESPSSESSASASSQTLPGPTSTAGSRAITVELWTAARGGPGKIPGLPNFQSFVLPLGITADHSLVWVTTENDKWLAKKVTPQIDVAKLVPGGAIGVDGKYYRVPIDCNATCSLDPVAGLSNVVDASGCLAVDSNGVVWQPDGDGCNPQAEPTALKPVQGVTGVVAISSSVIPGVVSVLTRDGSAYAWGAVSNWLPGCADGTRPLKLVGAPAMTRVQGLFGTDETGQMWTWIGTGRCTDDGTVVGAAQVVGPHDAAVAPTGLFFSDDGSIWDLGSEFDDYEMAAGQLPALQQGSLDGTALSGRRIVFGYKSSAGILVVETK